MISEVERSSATPSKLMHETVDSLSTIVSIAQFDLIGEEMSPKLREDMQRIIQTAREASACLRQLAKILQEED